MISTRSSRATHRWSDTVWSSRYRGRLLRRSAAQSARALNTWPTTASVQGEYRTFCHVPVCCAARRQPGRRWEETGKSRRSRVVHSLCKLIDLVSRSYNAPYNHTKIYIANFSRIRRSGNQRPARNFKTASSPDAASAPLHPTADCRAEPVRWARLFIRTAERRTHSTSLRVCGRIALRLAMLHSEAHNSMRTPMESTRRRRRHCHPDVVRPPRTHHRPPANCDSRSRERGTARLRPQAPQRNAPGKECRTALQCASATAQTLRTREHPSEHHPWMKRR